MKTRSVGFKSMKIIKTHLSAHQYLIKVLDFPAFLYEIFKGLWLAAIFQAQVCVISALKLPSSKKLSSIES